MATVSLQTQVAELEKLLVVEQDRSKRLEHEKEESAKTSLTAIESLRTKVKRFTSTKEDLTGQLHDKGTELANAKGEMDRLASILEGHRTQHIRSAKMLRDDVLELLAQCNLAAPSTSFPDVPWGPYISG